MAPQTKLPSLGRRNADPLPEGAHGMLVADEVSEQIVWQDESKQRRPLTRGTLRGMRTELTSAGLKPRPGRYGGVFPSASELLAATLPDIGERGSRTVRLPSTIALAMASRVAKKVSSGTMDRARQKELFGNFKERVTSMMAASPLRHAVVRSPGGPLTVALDDKRRKKNMGKSSRGARKGSGTLFPTGGGSATANEDDEFDSMGAMRYFDAHVAREKSGEEMWDPDLFEVFSSGSHAARAARSTHAERVQPKKTVRRERWRKSIWTQRKVMAQLGDLWRPYKERERARHAHMATHAGEVAAEGADPLKVGKAKGGIALTALKLLRDHVASIDPGMTTLEVSAYILRPLTHVHRASFCDTVLRLHKENHESDLLGVRAAHLGTATSCVVHAWGGRFVDLVDALEAHEETGGDGVKIGSPSPSPSPQNIVGGEVESPQNKRSMYWIDALQVSPWTDPSTWSFETFTKGIREVVEGCGGCVVALPNIRRPLPLMRGWAAFEMWMATRAALPVVIALPHSSRLDLSTELLGGRSLDSFIDNFTPPAWENMGAQSEEVKLSLTLAVRSFEGGRRYLHAAVRRVVLEWLAKFANEVSVAERKLEEERGTRLQESVETGAFRLMHRTAYLFGDLEMWDEARTLTAEVLRVEEAVHGKLHSATLKTTIKLALLEGHMGKYPEALGMLDEAYSRILQVGALGSPEHLLVLRHKGLVLHQSGDAAKSSEVYREAVEVAREHLGATHEATLRVMRKYALVLSEVAGSEKQAVEVAVLALQGLEALHGALDQRVMDSRAEIPRLMISAGMAADAVPVAESNLELNKEKWNEQGLHPDSMRAALLLTDVYAACGRIEDVPALLEPSIGAARQLSIDKTVAMLEVRHGLGVILSRSSKTLDLSLEIFEDVARDRSEVLGPEHPATLDSVVRKTELTWNFGDRGLAAAKHRDMLESLKRILGPAHPLTLRTSRSLSEHLGHQHMFHADAVYLAVDEADTCLKELGEEHPETLTSNTQAARVALMVGYTKYAMKYAKLTLSTLRRLLAAEKKPGAAQDKLRADVCSACGLMAAAMVEAGLTSQKVEDLIKESLGGIDLHNVDAQLSLKTEEEFTTLRVLGLLYTKRGTEAKKPEHISRGLDILNRVKRLEVMSKGVPVYNSERTRQAIADAKDSLAIVARLKGKA